MLDAQYNPKLAFHALKKLITETWRTNTTLTVGLDGAASFRGFFGDYQATVRWPSDETQTLQLSIKRETNDATLRLKRGGNGEFVPVPLP